MLERGWDYAVADIAGTLRALFPLPPQEGFNLSTAFITYSSRNYSKLFKQNFQSFFHHVKPHSPPHICDQISAYGLLCIGDYANLFGHRK